MGDSSSSEDISNIELVSFGDALGERYLAYALSTITSRSLPDVRDGLKPVHRRLLWAMLQLKLDPKNGFKKCARVVGDVIGKYHPHGDTAVYDTMVRLAQGFSVRYPLVDGQGNFGSIDGDNAAAMRYTEARLTDVAMELLRDINQNTVNFRETYDNQDIEPVVLPSAFPNLLANGSEGIAVGMATNIPPHNVDEICQALLYLIKTPNASIEKLVQFIKSPDFPTGGVIVETESKIVENYTSGKGAFRIRAKWEKEDLGHGSYQIIISEIPYQVSKSKLIEKIADLYKDKKLALLGNIRDESTEDVRVILEPKNRNVDAQMLMESLFKLTDLETRFNMNMNVLDPKCSPRVMNLREVLQAFLDHRHDVLIRKSKFRLGKINDRLEILEGLLVAYLNIDEVIHIIRTEDKPKQVMIAKWSLSEIQVEAILNMKLRNLRKLEEIELRKEHDELLLEKEKILELLSDEALRMSVISDQIKDIRKKFGKDTDIGKRRTAIEEPSEATVISIEAFVEKEPITIICSKLGWLRALKGHNNDVDNLKFKEGDEGRFVIKAYSTDKLVIISTSGKFYTIGCDKISRGKGHGEAIRLIIDMEHNFDVLKMFLYEEDKKLLVCSSEGKGFIVPQKDIVAQTKTGKQVLNIKGNATAALCTNVEGNHVAIIGENRKLLVYPVSEIPKMKRGQGVQLQRYRDGGISDVKTFNIEDGLTWSLGERIRTETNVTEWLGKRAHTGRIPPVGFPRNNKFT